MFTGAYLPGAIKDESDESSSTNFERLAGCVWELRHDPTLRDCRVSIWAGAWRAVKHRYVIHTYNAFHKRNELEKGINGCRVMVRGFSESRWELNGRNS